MIQLHGTSIALAGRGLLILGPSGSGKSSLALELMAVGAGLVADDRTDLRLDNGVLIASAPDPLRGRIEARGIGILRAEAAPPVPLAVVCNLGESEGDRLPPWRSIGWLGVSVPLVLGPYRPHLYAALRQIMLGERLA